VDHAGGEDFAVYRSPGTLPEPGNKEVRLGTIVVRGTPVRFPSSHGFPTAVPSDSPFLETQTPEWIVR